MAIARKGRRRMPRASRSSRAVSRRGTREAGSVLRALSPEEVARNRERLIVAVHYRELDWNGPRFTPRIHVNEDVDILSLLDRQDACAEVVAALKESDD